MKKYIGHSSQICGVDELMLTKGKGKGITLLEVRNGNGLQFTLSADRCMDIARVSYNGSNMGYFAPCGYVAPAYYDDRGNAFLRSFTAGFLTTCGLNGVGVPCIDEGVEIPMHGTVSNIPCENYYYTEDDESITVFAQVRDAALFDIKLLLKRTYVFSKKENIVNITDEIENIGVLDAPCELLYHFNMGYPLLSENAKVFIPHNGASARNAHAESGFDEKLVMEKPQADYEEMCFYYDVKETDGMASVGIFNPDINKGLVMSFDKSTLDFFTQWKMMGETEYVLGLEPGNCTPDGRDKMRQQGILKIIKPGETYKTNIKLTFTEKEDFVEKINK